MKRNVRNMEIVKTNNIINIKKKQQQIIISLLMGVELLVKNYLVNLKRFQVEVIILEPTNLP